MKVFRCSAYKIRGSQPPHGLTKVSLSDGCTFVVSANLQHINVDYFRSAILPNIILSGIFNQTDGIKDAEELDRRAVKSRDKLISDENCGCYLTVFSESEESEPLAEPNRKIGPYLVAIRNASAPTASQISHKHSVNAAISAFSVSAKSIDRAEKIFEANYRIDSELGCVHYFSASAYGEGRVISQLPDDFGKDFRSISERLRDHQNLLSVFRLLAASYTQNSDKLAAFLAAWSAFEIFVGKIFPSQETQFFSSLESSHEEFVSRLREVMNDKYRLTDKFALLASTVSAETAKEDIKAFKSFKKVRDELLHGGDIETSRLPLASIQSLLRRYFFVYINWVQT